MTDRRVGNWGRWGDEDERGALNLLSTDVVREALSAVSAGQVVTLGLPLSAKGTPAVPPRPCVVHTMMLDGADFEAGSRRGKGGFQFAEDYLAMPVHTGTHIDALSHVARHGRMYNDFPATSIRSFSGARKLSIERFGALVTRAIVLDVPAALGIKSLPDTHQITLDDVRAALALGGREVRSGDAVLIHTGWLERFFAGESSDYSAEPGIGPEATMWLAEQGVTLIGADNFAVELVPSANGDMMPVHLICLVDFGIHLMELVNLQPLLDAGVSECLLIVAPLPIAGGVGSPVNPVAVF